MMMTQKVNNKVQKGVVSQEEYNMKGSHLTAPEIFVVV